MKNKLKLMKQDSVITALNVALVFLVIVLLITILTVRTTYKEITSDNYDELSFSYAIEDQAYYTLLEKYYYNLTTTGKENPEFQEYYGVAKYYEAASLYKAYDTVGNTEKALYYQNKMQDYEKDMGDWSMAKPGILKSLELEE